MDIAILSTQKSPRTNNQVRRLYTEVIERGHEPHILAASQTPLAITKTGRHVLEKVAGISEYQSVHVDVVIPRLSGNSAQRFGYPVLQLLMLNNTPSTISSEAAATASNKWQTLAILDAAGIPVPDTVLPNGKTSLTPSAILKLLQPDEKGRMVVKTLRGSCGNGVNIVNSRQQAVELFQTLGPKSIEALGQEFIEPPLDGAPFDLRFIVAGKKVIAGMKRLARPGEHRSNISLRASGEPYLPTKQLRDIAIASAEAIGAEVIGCDMMLSDRGPVVTELNSNPGFRIEHFTGINVAGAIVDHAIHLAERDKSCLR